MLLMVNFDKKSKHFYQSLVLELRFNYNFVKNISLTI